MTADELRSHFNRVYGIEKEWPKTYEVDTDTYANCCQAVFKHTIEDSMNIIGACMNKNRLEFYRIELSIGPNYGLMFKNVELILKP